MSNLMYLFLLLVSVLIIGMYNANNTYNENLTVPHRNYIFGLRNEKEEKDNKEKDHKERHHKKRRHKHWHRDRNNWNPPEEEIIDRKIGEYKCYYSPGDGEDCSKCSILDHPDINKYILKSKIPPLPNMDEYILKTEIPIVEKDMTEYIHKSEIPDMSKYILKDELPDMSKYILKDDIDKYQKPPECPKAPECPTFPECPTCPIPDKIDMNKYMLKSECKNNSKDYKITDDNKVNFGDLLPDFMRSKAKCIVDDDFRRQSYQKRC